MPDAAETEAVIVKHRLRTLDHLQLLERHRPFLDDRQKAEAARLVQQAGASFVKTCTGFSPDPLALYEDVRLIRQTVGPEMGIKASGRVGNYFRYMTMLEAGATRVGLILEQAREILKGWEAAQAR